MKIYSYIKIGIDGEIIEEVSEEYEGPVVECKGNYTVPPPTEEEKAIQREILDQLRDSRQLQQQFMPMLLESSGYRMDAGGNISKMPYEEYLQTLDPSVRQSYENLLTIQEQTAKALKGELAVSPALEQELADQERQLKESMGRRLGADWQTSTAGVQALQEFEKKASSLREQARFGKIQTYGGLGAQGQQTYARSPSAQVSFGSNIPSYSSGLIPMYQGALQPFQQQRQMQLQANLAKAQAGDPFMNVLGTIGGVTLGSFLGGL
jgi:hypothetical protein